MNSLSRTLVALALAAVLSTPAYAVMLQSQGQVANLRIEGSAGFIGLSQPFPAGSNCGSGTRVFGECRLYDIFIAQ